SQYFAFLNDNPEAPKRLEVRLAVVIVLRESGDLQRALAEADKLISYAYKGGVRFETIYQRGRILEEMGRANTAEEAYQSLLSETLSKNLNAKVKMRLGYLYRMKGEYAGSTNFLNQALQGSAAKTTQLETKLLLGDNYFDLSQFAQARQNYQHVIEQAAHDDDFYFQALYKSGLAFQQLADYRGSNRSLQQLQTDFKPLSPQRAAWLEESYLHISQNNLQLKNGVGAVNALQKYMRQYPTSPHLDQIHFQIASIYQDELANPAKAIPFFQRFMEIYPESRYLDDAHYRVAVCYEKTGDYKSAFQTCQNFLVSFPGSKYYEKAQQHLEWLSTYRLSNPESALNQLTMTLGNYISTGIDGAAFADIAQLSYDDLKNYSQAITYYRKALQNKTVGTARDEIYYYLAKSFQHQAFVLSESGLMLTRPANLDSARIYFQKIRSAYAKGDWADDAAIGLVELNSANGIEPQVIANSLVQMVRQFPNSPRRDEMLFDAGMALLSTADKAPMAENYFTQVSVQFPDSPLAAQAVYFQGKSAFEQGNNSAAQTAFEKYLKKAPSVVYRPQALFFLAQLKQNNLTERIALYQELTDTYFYTRYGEDANLKIGELLLQQGESNAALHHLLAIEQDHQTASLQDVSSPKMSGFQKDKLIYEIARAYEAGGDAVNAKIRYQQYLMLAPHGEYVPTVLLALGKITQAGSQDADIALNYYERLKGQTGNQAVSYTASKQVADLLFQQDKFTEARQEYRQTVKLATAAAEKEQPASRIIVCSFRLGNTQEGEQAATAFENTYGKNPEYQAEFAYEKGMYYFNKKLFQKAEAAFTNIRKKFKQTTFAPKAELALGQLYIRTNKDEKALAIITQIPEKFPDSDVTPLAYINLGDYYLKEAKQPESAIGLYKKALAHPLIGAYQKHGMQNLITSYEMLGMYDQELALIRDQLAKYPNDATNFTLKIKIGSTYKALRQYELAITQFKNLLQTAPPDYEAEIQFKLAECYDLMGQYEKAVTEYLKVKYVSTQVEGLPWDVTAQWKAAQAYMKLKKYDDAELLFEKIIRSWGEASDFGRQASRQIEEIKRLRGE
ncbi:tetratricopeptide repeat protein, partial [bacterium]|nr:tetratricopeptide repeat protein [bacterium]